MEFDCPETEVFQLEKHLWARCIKHRISYVKQFLDNYEKQQKFYNANPKALLQILEALKHIIFAAIEFCNRAAPPKKEKLKENLKLLSANLNYLKCNLGYGPIVVVNPVDLNLTSTAAPPTMKSFPFRTKGFEISHIK